MASSSSSVATVVFALAALFSAGAMFSQLPHFDPHPSLQQILVLLHMPLLLVVGVFDARAREPDRANLPGWMRVPRLAALAYGLGFGFLSLVILLNWNLDLGAFPILPQPEWDLTSQILHFTMLSFGLGMLNFMAAAGTVVPLIQVFAGRAATWPLPAAIAGAVVLGGGVGAAFLALLSLPAVHDGLAWLQTTIESQPALGVVGIVAATMASTRSG